MTTRNRTTADRAAKARELAAGASSWRRGRLSNGRRFYFVPSQRPTDVPVLYMVDRAACSCQDWRRNRPAACKHVLAVRLFEQAAPATATAARHCGMCPATVRPESIYDLCDDCAYTYGAVV
jgi:SWIM zinc finger